MVMAKRMNEDQPKTGKTTTTKTNIPSSVHWLQVQQAYTMRCYPHRLLEITYVPYKKTITS